MTAVLQPGLHDYDDLVTHIVAGRYTFATVTAASGRKYPLIGVSAEQLASMLEFGKRNAVGLLLSGSRVVGPRSKQAGFHPLLAEATKLSSDHRLASDNYPAVDDVQIDKTAIKECGMDSPHTSDLSIILIDPAGRSAPVRAALAAELHRACLSLGLTFPVRIFSSLVGCCFSSEADYVRFHTDRFLRPQQSDPARYNEDTLAAAARELFAYFPPQGTALAWTDHELLTRDEYGPDRKFHNRVDILSGLRTNPVPWHRWLFDKIRAPAVARLLDVGCGPGFLWSKNLDRIPNTWTINLGDLSPAMILESQANVPASIVPIVRWDVLDAVALPFEDASCDVVIADSVLYHVTDLARAHSECCRVLRPNGLFHAATIGSNHLAEIAQLLQEFDEKSEVDLIPRGFILDDGVATLSPLFTDVELVRFPDQFVFPNAETLISYLRTFAIWKHLQKRSEELESFLARKFAGGSKLTVRSDVGLLLGRRPAK